MEGARWATFIHYASLHLRRCQVQRLGTDVPYGASATWTIAKALDAASDLCCRKVAPHEEKACRVHFGVRHLEKGSRLHCLKCTYAAIARRRLAECGAQLPSRNIRADLRH